DDVPATRRGIRREHSAADRVEDRLVALRRSIRVVLRRRRGRGGGPRGRRGFRRVGGLRRGGSGRAAGEREDEDGGADQGGRKSLPAHRHFLSATAGEEPVHHRIAGRGRAVAKSLRARLVLPCPPPLPRLRTAPRRSPRPRAVTPRPPAPPPSGTRSTRFPRSRPPRTTPRSRCAPER